MIFGISYLFIGIILFTFSFLSKKKFLFNLINYDLSKCIKISIYTVFCHILSIYSINFNNLFENQIIKSSEPVINIFLRYVFFSESINKKKIFPIILIIISTIISIFDFSDISKIKLSCNYYGIIYGLGSNLFLSLKSIETDNYIKKVSGIKLNNYEDNIYYFYNFINLISFLFMFYFIFLFENNISEKFVSLYKKENIFFLLVLSGTCFHLSNIYSIRLNYLTNPYTQIILGSSKRIIILILSKFIFNETINRFQMIGFLISIGSIGLNYFIK